MEYRYQNPNSEKIKKNVYFHFRKHDGFSSRNKILAKAKSTILNFRKKSQQSVSLIAPLKNKSMIRKEIHSKKSEVIKYSGKSCTKFPILKALFHMNSAGVGKKNAKGDGIKYNNNAIYFEEQESSAHIVKITISYF